VKPVQEGNTSLFDRLNSSTASLHAQIEQVIDPLRRIDSLEEYASLLVRNWGIYRPLEARLGQMDWKAAGIDFSARQKCRLLEKDLSALRISTADIETTSDLPLLPSINAGLGCLYVLEGATLGGQIISKHLHEKLSIHPDNGGAFYGGYGSKTGEMWTSFKKASTAYCMDEKCMSQAEQGAVETFQKFIHWFSVPAAVTNRSNF
jgi:heme oxygenase